MPSIQNTVIVAEDEALVRMVAAEMLAEAGFNVVEAGNATEALSALRACAGSVAVLFTDVHMQGGITGLELARLVKTQWPLVAILIASGQHRLSPGEIPPEGIFTTKPYQLESIVAQIKVLAGR